MKASKTMYIFICALKYDSSDEKEHKISEWFVQLKLNITLQDG